MAGEKIDREKLMNYVEQIEQAINDKDKTIKRLEDEVAYHKEKLGAQDILLKEKTSMNSILSEKALKYDEEIQKTSKEKEQYEEVLKSSVNNEETLRRSGKFHAIASYAAGAALVLSLAMNFYLGYASSKAKKDLINAKSNYALEISSMNSTIDGLNKKINDYSSHPSTVTVYMPADIETTGLPGVPKRPQKSKNK